MLTITSDTLRFGFQGNAQRHRRLAILLGAEPVATAGIDVAGTINGIAATGSGQFLTGADGSSAEGLKIQVTGDSLGARGTLDFSQGYASQLSKLIDGFLGSERPDFRPHRWHQPQHQGSSADSRDALNTRLTNIEAQYRKQFTALDVMLSAT